MQAVIETFAHDTLIPLASPSELNETTLSSSISSLKASASVKSSDSSLRTRRLAEIAEESGETPDQESTTDQNTIKGRSEDTAEASPSDTKKAILEEIEGFDNTSATRHTTEPSAQYRRPRKSSASSRNLDKALPPPPIDEIKNLSPYQREVEDISRNPSPSVKRQSSQSARPSAQDLYEDYIYAPKIKLGPRPSLDNTQSRSSGSLGGPRPVSTLPTGIHLPSASGRAQSQRAFSKPKFLDNSTMARHPPPTNRKSMTETERPTSKAGSIASVSTFAYVSEPKASTTTPEKQRLMKALQMRKKQMQKHSSEDVLPLPPSKAFENSNKVEAVEHGIEFRELNAVCRPENEPDVLLPSLAELDHGIVGNMDASPPFLTEPSSDASTKASPFKEADETSSRSLVSRRTNIKHASPDEKVETAIENGQDEARGAKGTFTEPRWFIGEMTSLKHPEQTNLNNSPNEERLSSNMAASKKTANAIVPFPDEVSLPDADEEENTFFKSSPSTVVHEPAHENIRHSHEVLDILPGTIAPDKSESERDESRTRPSTSDSLDFSNMQRKTKRRGLVEPLRIVSSAEHSDENFLLDDSFMDELQSATLEEAKPISVSRSPVTPVFPMSPKSTSTTRSHDTLKLNFKASNPLDDGPPRKRHLLTPDLLSPRSDSRAERSSSNLLSPTRAVSNPLANELMHLQRQLLPTSPVSPARRSISLSPIPRETSDQTASMLPKKGGVSSLISQRIKALEKSSNSGSQSPASSPVVTPAIVMKHKGSFSTLPNNQTSSDTPLDGNKWRGRKDLPYPTPSPSPHGYVVSRKFGDAVTASVTAAPRIKSRPESVSVTATIVRDAHDPKPKAPLNPSEPTQTTLHHSPLLVQQYALSASANSDVSKKPSIPKSSSEKSDSSGGLATKMEKSKSARRGSIASKQSDSSHQGSIDGPRPLSQASSDGQICTDVIKEGKKESRKTRLFKRMSAISSSSRRSLAQALGPSVKEEPIVERQELETQPSSVLMDFGDLNVQFPDTLVCETPFFFVKN